MDKQLKELMGNWIQAIGTVISAIGSTPSTILSEDFRKDLGLVGNVLQGAGNALLADVEREITLEKIGNEIQAIGNSTVVAGMIIDFEEETQQKLIITGNWFQALGGLTSIGDELQDESGQPLNIIANLLQSIGNSMQALGGIVELQYGEAAKEKSQRYEINGSWIQAVGSVLSLLIQIEEE
ncbi:hypothetical protein J2S13_002971 [Oikeobacillus pervagus]|uniref:Uncharacterized protein n=1 Tax=Oikeobacillus pervagus TaxID=1325931 RepID=A0AAJ1WLS1_9BACI|nr:hypothetical protein [Oikeobacillus pervagus]MDQ0216511.1 hypothetical protein [Oikeobacillus pervagus]